MGNIYHILNRGVNKDTIFLGTNDYLRFVYCLHRFNNQGRRLGEKEDPKEYLKDPPPQEKLVNILKWSLMPNHYHILVEELVPGGALKFVQRVGNGYTKFFNIKNERKGYLFQNSAKIIRVEKDEHFRYLPFYIDANPVDLIYPDWEKGKPSFDSLRTGEAFRFLKAYRWSDYFLSVGSKEFPMISDKKAFFELYETNEEKYLASFHDWLVENI